MSTSRIPRLLAKFDQYIKATVPFLAAGNPSNGSRLGLTAAETTQAQGFLAQWYTGDPASPDDASAKLQIFTRATFTLYAGSAAAGQKLHVFARWYSTKHPELAGPWSSMAGVMIA